jgi:hypothetical protein
LLGISTSLAVTVMGSSPAARAGAGAASISAPPNMAKVTAKVTTERTDTCNM